MGAAATPSPPQLLCVAPSMVASLWPRVGPLIRLAIERTGLSLFSVVEADAMAGKSLVWIAWNGEAIEAAAVTRLELTDAGRVCVIVACSGEDRRRWLPLLSQIEAYALAERCELVRLFGREGWQRVLDGYSRSAVVLDKRLVA